MRFSLSNLLSFFSKVFSSFDEFTQRLIPEDTLDVVRLLVFCITLTFAVVIYPVFYTMESKQVKGYDAYINNFVSINGKMKIIDRDKAHKVKFSNITHIVGDHDCITMNDSILELAIKPMGFFKLFLNDQVVIPLSIENNSSVSFTGESREKSSVNNGIVVESTVSKFDDKFEGINKNTKNNTRTKSFSSKDNLEKEVNVTILAMPEKFLSILKEYGSLVFILLIGLAMKSIFKCI